MIQPRTFPKYGAQRPAARRMAIVLGGFAASLLLHGLVLVPLVWGGHLQRQRTLNNEGSSASSQDVKSLQSTIVIFMEDSAAIRDPSRDEDTPSSRFLLPRPPLFTIARPRISAAALNLIEEPEDRTAMEANGDQAGRSMLFGRYMGQISARVERAWMRPRSVPNAGSFACRVQITQDRAGNVQEVTLEKCTDDPQWEVSLVRAISGASPLPAPPDPGVFSNLLTIEFDSDPYIAGASDQGFEPVVRIDSSGSVQSNVRSRSQPISGSVTRQTRPDGSINLTIVGSSDHPP